jgi:hypothetical protein
MRKKIALSIISLFFTSLFFNTVCTKVPAVKQDLSSIHTPPPRVVKVVSTSEPDNETPADNPGLHRHNALIDKTEVANWVQENFTHYYQKYNLSCEAALIRMICGIWGIYDLDEDDILDLIPVHPSNPELGLVMKNIQGDVFLSDGSVNWANYGAHPPVVKETLETILRIRQLDSLYYIEQKKLDNKQLIALLKNEPACLGAIIWVAAYINKKKPPVNEIGQVLGEHVQYVSPVLDTGGRMLVYDVWPWENQPFHLFVPFNRELFDYETLLIMRKK